MREPGKLPSRAVKLHEQIYRENPDVNSIILTQSPNVMAFGVSQAILDVRTIPESWIFLSSPLVNNFLLIIPLVKRSQKIPRQ